MCTVCSYDTPQWTGQTDWTINRTDNSVCKTFTVIVKIVWTAYLFTRPQPPPQTKKQWNILDQNIMQTQHFHLKFYAANIIFTKVMKKGP